ncbi:diguanylate cyclase [Skermanella mucosa]|uniref:GGDEF domain-containing protein n=1 Tax=Skermanella mucosa TaxID=1789672 RepID=UPI00192BF46F|nr:diguanylate cyclase [Skermanella mucosa]UEM21953.1 diguanylate cyclase [Skermanella mucosa]
MFAPAGHTAETISVLLVEDQPGDAGLVTRALGGRRGQFEVTWVETLAHALTLLAEMRYDVVLLDLSLPDSQGFQTIGAVRHAAPTLPLIVLTGLSDNDMALAAVEAGAQDFLVKGEFEEAMIERAVRHAIARGQLEERLRRSEARLKNILDLAHDAVVSVDAGQRIVLFNPAAERMFGYRTDEILGEPLSRLVPEPLRARHSAHFGEFLRNAVTSQVMADRPEVGARRRDGTVFPVEISLSRSEGPEGPIFTAMIRDITGRKRTEAELVLLATTDPLTGIANRRHLLDCAEREMARLGRSGTPFSLIMADVDHFKRINDTYGHAVGDEALMLLASAFRPVIRENDLAGRMGGEEFAILLPEAREDEAVAVAERVRHHVAGLRLPARSAEGAPGAGIRFTVSLGVAEGRRDDSRIEQPLARADQALYEAKAAGRNRVMRAGAARGLVAPLALS